MERWTHEEFCECYRIMDEPPQEEFAEWLDVGPRSVQRWLNEPDKRPNVSVSLHLDNKLRQAVRERVRWLPADQVKQMQRRELLRLLAASAVIPVGGSLVWNARLPRISTAALSSLEDITAVLASKFNTGPSHTLLGAATGHLEGVSGLLQSAVMEPTERQRLESIVADVCIFIGA